MPQRQPIAAEPRPAPARPLERFLSGKAHSLANRAHRLAALTPDDVGLRDNDVCYGPRPEHFDAANRRLRTIDRAVDVRLKLLRQTGHTASPEDRLLSMAMVERELDRARRAFGMFFEVFAQRGTAFGPSLAAHDALARDCYAVVRANAPRIFPAPLVPPLTYMEHGYSPATMRRGITLGRLLGELNPFPLIRIPFDRDHPWEAVFLHEVAHNLQADLGLWVDNKNAIVQRLAEQRFSALTISILSRWHKEIFADLAAALLGGPAVAWGLAEFLAHPADKVMTYRPGGAHPTGYLRVLILAEMLRRMNFADQSQRLLGVWKRLFDPRRGHRIPTPLLAESRRAIPAIVDEIAFQPRRPLAERALASIIPFRREDQAAIRRAGALLARRIAPSGLPPRFLVGAARYAIEAGVGPEELSDILINLLVPQSRTAGAGIQLKAA